MAAVSSLLQGSTCTVTFNNGRARRYPLPVQLTTLCCEPELTGGKLLAVKLNGIVVSLNSTCTVRKANVEPIFMESTEGWSVYRRTLVFVMAKAAFEEFGKEWKVTLEHYSGGAGYMCAVNGDGRVTKEELDRLRKRMNTIIEADLPILETLLSYQEALQLFQTTGMEYSQLLVETSNDEAVKCNICGEFAALCLRALAPRTSCIHMFDVFPSDYGFILRFPSMKIATLSEHYEDDKLMNSVFREYNECGRTLRVRCVGDLNLKIVNNQGKNFIAMSEALHNQKIVQIALQISATPRVKIVLIAGPSASGKTTFASKLKTQLCILGLEPIVISTDNYFVPRTETPKDAKGQYDFECLEAMRIDLLNEHLVDLVAGKQIDMPIFDFRSGRPRPETIPVKLPPKGVIVMEGIHCLNDKLTPRIPREQKFKIFMAPLSQINMDEYNFMSNSIARLLRRVVRDYNHRGFSAQETLGRWESVSAGEEKHIFPFMNSADIVCNTALDYEPCVLKSFLVPLLKSVKPDSEMYHVARNLMFILDLFLSLPHDHVPPSSLLREFIGGSFYE